MAGSPRDSNQRSKSWVTVSAPCKTAAPTPTTRNLVPVRTSSRKNASSASLRGKSLEAATLEASFQPSPRREGQIVENMLDVSCVHEVSLGKPFGVSSAVEPLRQLTSCGFGLERVGKG